MTNAIERMYKEYGVEPSHICTGCENLNEEDTIMGCYSYCCKLDLDNRKCGMAKSVYPPFTCEKQIELIKFIGLERGFKIIPNEGYDYMLSETTFAKYKYNKHGYSMTNFTEALADLTLNLKDGLDNVKVKEILER